MAKERLTLSIKTAAYEAAKEAAEKDHRSLSNWVEILIMNATGGKK